MSARKAHETAARIESEKMARIVLLDRDRCKPNTPAYDYLRKLANANQCGRGCIFMSESRCHVLEEACPACLNNAKRCPGGAVRVVNVPHTLAANVTYRYGPNAFKLHRLPTPRTNQVLGLVGTNGIGKSTALQILGGRVQPNLGKVGAGELCEWEDALAHFRGSELQAYFTRLLDHGMAAVTKPQYVDQLAIHLAGWTVDELLRSKDERGAYASVAESLSLGVLRSRRVEELSGGELQRVAIGLVLVQKADAYLFDEPSSYLDIMQRLRAARAIRTAVAPASYVLAVEHDLSLLDYLSDGVCLFYGDKGAYGVATPTLGTREAINAFLSGYLPSENLRFRPDGLSFRPTHEQDAQDAQDEAGASATLVDAAHDASWAYPAMSTSVGSFALEVEAGALRPAEVIVLLGQNGMGKTLLLRALAGTLDASVGGGEALPPLQVSYKPQRLSAGDAGSLGVGCVSALLKARVGDAAAHERFAADVLEGLGIGPLLDRRVEQLSGGELQRVAIALALGTPADLYLIDEPSAYLDSEQRVTMARVLKRFVQATRKTALVVEHDFMVATYLASRVIVYEGTPAVSAVARAPQPLRSGMNLFLKGLEVTFRRDPETGRPRINKYNSVVDKEQKKTGDFFYAD
jgi:ATP-binding cassette subfamily E protein 1